MNERGEAGGDATTDHQEIDGVEGGDVGVGRDQGPGHRVGEVIGWVVTGLASTIDRVEVGFQPG